MISTISFFLALCCPPAPLAATASEAPPAPTYLRVEYLVEPLGIDERKPRFSWELEDKRRGALQSAYQVLVAQDPEQLAQDKGGLWDSGKVASNATCQVEYAGAALEAGKHCWWKVRSWDGAGQPSPWSQTAHWSNGPLEREDWKGKFIGDPTPVKSFQLGNRGWSSKFADKSDDFKWLQFDLGKGTVWNLIRIYPARSDDGQQKAPFLAPLNLKVYASDAPLFDSYSGPTMAMRVDPPSEMDVQMPASGPLEIRTTSRINTRYMRIGFYKLAKDDTRGFGVALAEVEVFDDFQGMHLVSPGKVVTASDSREEDGWSLESVNDGEFESRGPEGDDPLPGPRLRREFDSASPVTRATLTCSALGLYEASINGKRVSEDVLAPGWTDYKSRENYQTYDVTALIAPGRNAIGVQLADGWYSGRIGLAQLFVGGPRRALYGRKPGFLGELVLEHKDGKRERIITDESWKSTLRGPLRSADLIDGETWDARMELDGWDRAGYDDKSWNAAEFSSGVRALPNAQRGTPTRVVEELPAVSVTQLKPGTWLYDFGRNISGWCKLEASAPAGTTLVLRHGEMKNPDGTLYTANLRSAQQTDRYVFKGAGSESWEPRFTTHGFRYVEASGTQAQPLLVARVVSNAAEPAGEFHAQHPVLTKLWENIGTSLRANIQSIPTDCPSRDERLGWMGDIQAFAPTAMYQRDLAAFFTQWLQTVRDGYTKDRRFSDFSPNPFDPEKDFSGAPGWADAGVFVPYACWQMYGDARLIKIQMPLARRWVDRIAEKNPDFLWKTERMNDYGDWLNGSQIDAPGWKKEGCEMPKDLFATAFFARSAAMVAEMAAALGGTELAVQYLGLHDKIKAAFQKAWIKPDGTIEGDTQAGYAIALAFDLVPPALQPLVLAKLSVSITEKRAWHMTTGMQSTNRMLQVLSDNGREEIASRLVRQREFPSWGWQIDQGATSMWERWDGWMPERGFQDPSMNSFNHFAFGAVGEWLMRSVAGIETDPDAPGFERIRIAPRAGEQIPKAGGRYHSIRGWIETDWRIDGDRFVLDVTIPANTSATVVLPALSVEAVREGGKSASEAAPNVLPTGFANGKASFDVRAGRYHFESQFKVGNK